MKDNNKLNTRKFKPIFILGVSVMLIFVACVDLILVSLGISILTVIVASVLLLTILTIVLALRLNTQKVKDNK